MSHVNFDLVFLDNNCFKSNILIILASGVLGYTRWPLMAKNIPQPDKCCPSHQLACKGSEVDHNHLTVPVSWWAQPGGSGRDEEYDRASNKATRKAKMGIVTFYSDNFSIAPKLVLLFFSVSFHNSNADVDITLQSKLWRQVFMEKLKHHHQQQAHNTACLDRDVTQVTTKMAARIAARLHCSSQFRTLM